MTSKGRAEVGRPVSRAYTFVDVFPDAVDTLIERLCAESGVVAVDRVASPTNIVVITEAPTYEDLLFKTSQALMKVKHYTRSVRFLPVHPALAVTNATARAA